MQPSSPKGPPVADGLRVLGGHSLIYAASSLVGQLGSLLTFPLYTRSLGPSLYGVLALALSAAGVLRTLAIAGTNTALMHESIDAPERDARRVSAGAMSWVVGASFLVGVALVVSREWLSQVLTAAITLELAVAISIYIAMDSLLEVVLALARAQSRPADYAYANALKIITTFITGFALLVGARLGPEGAVFAMATGSLLSAAWLAVRIGVRPEFVGSWGWIPRLVRQGAPLVPANVASWVADLSDRYLLLLLAGSSATVGLYSAGYRIGALVTALFVGPFHAAFLPLALKTYDQPGGERTYDVSSRLFVAFGAAAVLVLQALSVPMVYVLAGPAYAGAERVVGVVALGCLLSGATMLMTPAALKSGRSRFLAEAYGVGAVVNVALNLLLIPRFGMQGAAFATLAGYTAVLATMYALMPRSAWPAGSSGVVMKVVPVTSLCTLGTLANYGSAWRQFVASVLLAAAGLGGLVVAKGLTGADLRLVGGMLGSLTRAVSERGGAVLRPARDWLRRLVRVVKRSPRAVRDIYGVASRRRARRSERIGGWRESSPYSAFVRGDSAQLERATRDCDRLMAGEIATFGLVWQWRTPGDWRLDAWSGRRWAKWVPAALVDVNRVVRDSDVQCPWETSRLEHVWRVALCYAHTGEETQARWAIERLDEWARANPVGFGVNWTVAMEVGLRAIAIAESRVLLRDSPAWDERVEERITGLLADHVAWVIGNLERWGSRTQNHYLASLVGVVTVAHHLPDWDRLQAELEWVYEALFDCVEEQVLPDGVNFENSIGYHLLVTELVAFGMAICRSSGRQVRPEVLERLRGMVEYAEFMRFADGSPVSFGDDDDDYILPSVAAPFSAGRPCVGNRLSFPIHVLGGAPSGKKMPRVFPEAGVYGLGGERLRAYLNLMPTGVNGTGPHRHNDPLSFCVELDGRPVLGDPGTYRYQSSSGARNQFRSVGAHNTIQIDAGEPNDLAHLFALDVDRIAMQCSGLHLEPGVQRVQGSHAGFESRSGIRHARSWEYEERTATLRVHDWFEGPGEHHFVARLHAVPGVDFAMSPDGPERWVAVAGGLRIEIAVEGSRGACARAIEGVYSRAYRWTEASRVLEVEWNGTSGCRMVMSMAPVEHAGGVG